MLCFDKDISEERLEQLKVVLSVQYPYAVLNEEGESQLSRCTSETTYHHIGLIDVSWGQGIFDEISIMRGLAAPESREYFKKMTTEWEKYEKQLAKEITQRIVVSQSGLIFMRNQICFIMLKQLSYVTS